VLSLLLQSSQPALQEAIWQLPVPQVAVACPLLHDTPQPAQFDSVLSGVSQPLFLLPSQSPQPDAQVGEQPLVVQELSP
jgi:hypothetical protein